MRRLMTKNWKVIAYLLGFAVLVVAELDAINMFYTGAGMAWLAVWFLRNCQPPGTSPSCGTDDHVTRQRLDRYLQDHWTRSYHS